MRLPRAALLVCLALAPGTACRTLAGAQSAEQAFPDTGVKLTHVGLAFPGETDGTLTLHLEVESPRGNAARIEALRFELFLEGRHFASGARRLGIPMQPSTVRDLELTVPLALPRQRMLQGERPLNVEVRGSLSVYEGGSPDPWLFAWKGRVVSDGAPAFEDDQPWED